MTRSEILGAVGSIFVLAAIITLGVIVLARWANAYVERHQHPRRVHPPEFFRPARNRSRWG